MAQKNFTVNFLLYYAIRFITERSCWWDLKYRILSLKSSDSLWPSHLGKQYHRSLRGSDYSRLILARSSRHKFYRVYGLSTNVLSNKNWKPRRIRGKPIGYKRQNKKYFCYFSHGYWWSSFAFLSTVIFVLHSHKSSSLYNPHCINVRFLWKIRRHF